MEIRKKFLVSLLVILIILNLSVVTLATQVEDHILVRPDINAGNNNDEANEDTNLSNNVGVSDEGEDTNTENTDEQPSVDVEPQVEEPTQDNIFTQELSDNANLRELILNVEGLSPQFEKDVTDYYLVVDLTVETVDIEAYPEDTNSIVMIDGNTNIQEGENTILITVKAEAGNTKTYTINVTKTDDVDRVNANLKNLSVKGFNFYPTFKKNIYIYNLTINKEILQLEIEVEPEIEEATYEIIGNENFTEGDNLIRIIVTAKDGTTKREYKINTYISSKNVEIQEIDKKPAIILIAILVIAIIVTAIAISKRH